MPLQIASVVFGDNDGSSVIELDEGFVSELILALHTEEVESAPGALTVSIVDAGGTGDIVFRVDGREVFRHEPDPDGGLDYASIPVPDLKDASGNHLMQPGVHTLKATQGAGVGTAEFTIINPPPPFPENIPEDAPPALVPGSVQPTGVRRWVFQDLAPGGLGSWVLPMNPAEMDSPPLGRELSARTTTASQDVGGRFHVFEDAFTPAEWAFSGYCPTEEMREQLEAFADLNRRWYLHDHRGRAWKVTFQALELTPRKTEIWNGERTHQGHDYQATVLVLDRDWIEVI